MVIAVRNASSWNCTYIIRISAPLSYTYIHRHGLVFDSVLAGLIIGYGSWITREGGLSFTTLSNHSIIIILVALLSHQPIVPFLPLVSNLSYS